MKWKISLLFVFRPHLVLRDYFQLCAQGPFLSVLGEPYGVPRIKPCLVEWPSLASLLSLPQYVTVQTISGTGALRIGASFLVSLETPSGKG